MGLTISKELSQRVVTTEKQIKWYKTRIKNLENQIATSDYAKLEEKYKSLKNDYWDLATSKDHTYLDEMAARAPQGGMC